MINVNQITSQLAKMPDQALQQYAAMHKNDPYTVSLALSESNRRKQMRNASQGAQGMQPQPKVVDQAVAGMSPQPQMQPQMPQGQAQAMPEDTGIAQLPAGNMNFAEGGIISFADGGLNARAARQMQEKGSIYDSNFGLPPDERQRLAQGLDPADLARLQEAQRTGDRAAVAQTLRKLAAAGADRTTLPLRGVLGAANMVMQSAGDTRVGRFLGLDSIPPIPESVFGGNSASMTPYMDRVNAAPGVASPTAQGPSMTAAQPATQTYTRTGGNPGGGATTAQLPAAAPTGTQRPAGIAQLRPAAPARTLETTPVAPAESVDPFAQRTKEITARELAVAETGLASLKTDLSDEATAMFKGRDERANKREGELEKSKGTNTGMAFLEAGLAMMQSKGRGLAGIAQGAGVGTKAYAAGLDKIKSAQEKLDEARDRTEELRQNQSSMSKREIRAAEGRRDAIGVQGEKDLLTGLKLSTGEDRKDIRAALAAQIASNEKYLDRKNALRVADITAAGNTSRVSLAEQRLELDTLKARATSLQDQIKRAATLDKRVALQRKLDDVNILLAGGTIGTPSPDGTVLTFDAQGNLVK
jgi:hypothetical protein